MSIDAGNLNDFSLPDLFHIIGLEKRTGCLSVRVGPFEGAVDFAQGEVVRAALGPWRGEEAIRRLFAWEEGRFQFQATDAVPAREIATTTANLVAAGLAHAEAWREIRSRVPVLEWSAGIEIASGVDAPSEPRAARLVTLAREAQARGEPITFGALSLAMALPEAELAHVLEPLLAAGMARVTGRRAYVMQRLFERLAGVLWARFAAISGQRMVEDLSAGLRSACPDDERKTWLLADGRPSVTWLTTTPREVQLAFYQDFLARMVDYIGRAYGVDFAARALAEFSGELTEDEHAILDELKPSTTAHTAG